MGPEGVKAARRAGGADARAGAPPFLAEVSPVFHAANTSKRSITLDLRDPAAGAWLVEYLGGVDGLVQNLGPGGGAALGLGPAAPPAKHPRPARSPPPRLGRPGAARPR